MITCKKANIISSSSSIKCLLPKEDWNNIIDAIRTGNETNLSDVNLYVYVKKNRNTNRLNCFKCFKNICHICDKWFVSTNAKSCQAPHLLKSCPNRLPNKQKEKVPDDVKKKKKRRIFARSQCFFKKKKVLVKKKESVIKKGSKESVKKKSEKSRKREEAKTAVPCASLSLDSKALAIDANALQIANKMASKIYISSDDPAIRPGGPLKVNVLNKTTVKLNWNEPTVKGPLKINGYLILKSEFGSGQWNQVGKILGGKTETKISHLSPAKCYRFGVAACTALGVSDPIFTKNAINTSSTKKSKVISTDSSTPATKLEQPNSHDNPTTETELKLSKEQSKSNQIALALCDSRHLTQTDKCIQNPMSKLEEYVSTSISDQRSILSKEPHNTKTDFESGDTFGIDSKRYTLTAFQKTPKSVVLMWDNPGKKVDAYTVAKQELNSKGWKIVGKLNGDISFPQFEVKDLQEGKAYNFRVDTKGVLPPLVTDAPLKLIKATRGCQFPGDNEGRICHCFLTFSAVHSHQCIEPKSG